MDKKTVKKTAEYVISDYFAASMGGLGISHAKGWFEFKVPTRERVYLTRRVKWLSFLSLEMNTYKKVLLFINGDIEAAIDDASLNKGKKVTVVSNGSPLDKENILEVALESGRVIYTNHNRKS